MRIAQASQSPPTMVRGRVATLGKIRLGNGEIIAGWPWNFESHFLSFTVVCQPFVGHPRRSRCCDNLRTCDRWVHKSKPKLSLCSSWKNFENSQNELMELLKRGANHRAGCRVMMVILCGDSHYSKCVTRCLTQRLACSG